MQLLHLHYQLTRSERLLPHLSIWNVIGLAYAFAVTSFVFLALMQSAWFLLAAVIFAFFSKGFWIGLIDSLATPLREMDIVLEERGLGFLVGKERFWVFLDGITKIGRIRSVVAIQHINGTVVNVQTRILRESDYRLLLETVEKARSRTSSSNQSSPGQHPARYDRAASHPPRFFNWPV